MSTSNMPDGWQKEFDPNYIPPFQQAPLCDFDKLFSGDTGTKEKNTIDIDHFIKNVCKPHSIKDDVALAFAMDENGNINEKIFRSTLENAKLDEYKKAPNTNTLCQHEINTYYDKQVKQYPNAITDFKRAEALRNELDIKFAEKGEQVPMGFKNDGLTRFNGTVEYKTADRDQYYVDPTETKILSQNQYYELLKDEHGDVTNDSLIKFYNTYDLRKPGSLEHLKEVLSEKQKGEQNNKDEYLIAPNIDVNDPKKPLEKDPNSTLEEPLGEQLKEDGNRPESDVNVPKSPLANDQDYKPENDVDMPPAPSVNNGIVDQEPAQMNNGPANGNTNTMAGPDNQVS